MMFDCSYCEKQFNTSILYIKHLKHYHMLSNGDTLKCSKNCSHTYKSFQGLKYHINFYHKENKLNTCIELNAISNSECANVLSNKNLDPSTSHENLNEKFDNCDLTTCENPRTPLDIQKNINNFVLFLYHLHLPESYIKQIININNFNTREILERVKLITSSESLTKEFTSLKIDDVSVYKYRRNIYIQHNLVKPKDIQIGIRVENKYDKTTKRYVQKSVPITMTYTPILEQLQFLLSNEVVAYHIKNPYSPEQGYLTCYADGEKFKIHPLFSKEVSIRINLYYDEFDVCNGLGSKATIHKIGAIYFTLDNLPRKLNSKLQNINMVLLFHSQDIKTVTLNNILRPLVDDLKILEKKGIRVLWSENFIKGGISLYSGDNLGSNSILGFVECFIANYFCRICLASKQDSYTMVKEDLSLLRTAQAHLEHVTSNKINLSSAHTFGVKYDSILNDLDYFNASENNSVDIMHDLLEGIVQIEIKLVLKELIRSGFFTEEIITQRIHSFDYGTNESSNKPVSFNLNKPGQDLGLSACQSWCLIRYILFMIAFDVPENNKFLNLIQLLIQIMHIVFAPRVTIGLTYELETLIEMHHKLFMELFPEKHLLPKHHFMVHYGRMFREYGNLINFFCMRYEAKHYVFVKLASRVQNFKNITFSLSNRHQLDLAYSFASKNYETNNLLTEAFSLGKQIKVDLLDIDIQIKLQLKTCSDVVQTYKWVQLNGIKHSVGNYIFLGRENENYLFGKITLIFTTTEDRVLFYINLYSSEGINQRYQSYSIVNVLVNRLVPAEDIKDYQSFQIIYSIDQKNNEMYISTKHILL